EDLMGQIGSRPIAMVLAAVFLVVLMVTPLPKPPLILIAAGVGGLGYMLFGRRRAEQRRQVVAQDAKPPEPEKIEKCLTVDALELEVGYGLIKLVDKKQGGDLLERIQNIRRQ